MSRRSRPTGTIQLHNCHACHALRVHKGGACVSTVVFLDLTAHIAAHHFLPPLFLKFWNRQWDGRQWERKPKTGTVGKSRSETKYYTVSRYRSRPVPTFTVRAPDLIVGTYCCRLQQARFALDDFRCAPMF